MSLVRFRHAKVRGPRQNLRKQNGMARRSSAMIPHPPMISSFNVVHGTTLRFVNVSSAASGLQISWQNLLDTILFSTTAVVGHDLF
jgi:hypothetical protein